MVIKLPTSASAILNNWKKSGIFYGLHFVLFFVDLTNLACHDKKKISMIYSKSQCGVLCKKTWGKTFRNTSFFTFYREKLCIASFCQKEMLQKRRFVVLGPNTSVTILNRIVGFLNRVQDQRVLILYFCFFFKDNKAHNVIDKDIFF